MNHLDEFQNAWDNPEFVKIELAPLDVNQVLARSYRSTPSLSMTKTQLWDMETHKASRPDLFIPSVIKAGSAASWGYSRNGKADLFTRVSKQRLWLDDSFYGTVIESVRVDHTAKVVTFIGEAHANSPEHGEFNATDKQPLFHVQHGVIGDEHNPQNTWKIVHLTSKNRSALERLFEKMNHAQLLPEYIEIYLREVTKINLQRIAEENS
ncbi:hypothetical protein [Pseudidiomarina aestuarii]|uniref:hypothetical protein n=1 Tax=Pseudidiomarina aestuarii TaxID=624146 RepID=UPI003A973DAF